ncbi:MAG: hypothetical protein ACRDSJ_00620 [Rubrobacteraceae bacterium]
MKAATANGERRSKKAGSFVRAVANRLRNWPEWVGYAAAVWSLFYGTLGLYWALGGAGFPFGTESDSGAAGISILAGARANTVAPIIAGLGLAGAVAAVAMARGRSRSILRVVLLAFAWIVAATLAIFLPDYRVLVAVAYAPIAFVGAPFGWPPVNYFEAALPWPVINQFLCIGGGLVWAGAALAYHRRVRGACGNCGRSDARAGWTTPEAAARWGRWAVYVSFVVPILYALTRGAWAVGIPLGITAEFLGELQSTGLVWAGAGLAAVAVGGAFLTLGLIQRWGEVFPRWVPLLSERRVPIPLAVVPASLVSVLVGAAGVMFVRLTLFGTFRLGERTLALDENWAALAPELLWPLWGAALGAATLAYYYRRRGACGHCGRG